VTNTNNSLKEKKLLLRWGNQPYHLWWGNLASRVPPGRSRETRLRRTPSCGSGRRCLPLASALPLPQRPHQVEKTWGKVIRQDFSPMQCEKYQLKIWFFAFRRGRGGPRQRVPVMKHSSLARVTRLGHPKKEFDFAFGFRLGHPKKEFDFSKKNNVKNHFKKYFPPPYFTSAERTSIQ